MIVLGFLILGVAAAGYAVIAWLAAGRFGARALLVTWPVATLIMIGYQFLSWRIQAPRGGAPLLPWYAYVIGAVAVSLGFGAATRTLWRRFTALEAPRRLTAATVLRATSAFFLGLLAGVLPLLVLDVIALVRQS